MSQTKWVLALLAMGLSVACGASGGGALGPNGYTESKAKYRVAYSEPSAKRFLPQDWTLDNYHYDASDESWSEKKGDRYRATRRLDEDGDGTISGDEIQKESLFDLRFVNSRDNSVIWFKLHPMAFNTVGQDLDVVFDGYADGLEGTGLFEQSTLFGLQSINARHFTTFALDRQATTVGPLSAIRGTIEVADVEKLRLDAQHRDAKGVVVFTRVAYPERVRVGHADDGWPTFKRRGVLHAKRTGLLVIGYWADAAHFDAHRSDFEALLHQIVIPHDAIPDHNEPAAVRPPPHPVGPEPAAQPDAATSAPAAAAPDAPSP